ncbi:MAG: hypothetical protein K6T85_05265, partial [Gorillibacterium sp.]|nr:hypothetical protein [Gorillibacterium sp.]
MPIITARPFDQEMQDRLGETLTGYHAGELSTKEKSKRPEEIYTIEAEDDMVRYAVIWEYDSGNTVSYTQLTL